MEARKASGIKIKALQLLNTFNKLPVSDQARLYAGELRKSIENECFLVAVLATWNTGKSTFINALQGEPLLPMQNKETTHIVNRLSYSGKRFVSIRFSKDTPSEADTVKSLVKLLGLTVEREALRCLKISCRNYQDQRALLEMLATDDGYLDKYADIYKKVFHEDLLIPFPDFDEVRDKYRELNQQETDGSDRELFDRWITLSRHFTEKCLRKIQGLITEIELGVPLPLLKHGIQILDTPGAESFDEMRDEVLENYIKFAHCVVFIFRFDQPGATEDIEFRRIIHEYGIEDVFLVLNRIDGARSNDEQWDAIAQVRQNLHTFVKGEIFLYPVSSLGALIVKLSRGAGKKKTHPYVKKHARFVKRNDNEKFKEYHVGFQKFYDDLDRFLSKVDKFRKIIQAAANFITIEAGSLVKQIESECSRKEQSAEYRKLLDNEKRLELIWDEWREEISKLILRIEEEIEGTSHDEVNTERVESIVKNSSVGRSDFSEKMKYGFSKVMNAVVTVAVDDLRASCEDWVNVKPLSLLRISRLEEFFVPRVKRTGENITAVMNDMILNYYQDAGELSDGLYNRLAEWIQGLFSAASPVGKAGVGKPVSARVPVLEIPLPPLWKRMTERGRRLFNRNEIEWREEFRDLGKEIVSSVEHQLRSYVNRETAAQAQQLIRKLDKTLESQLSNSKAGILKAFREEHEKGYKSREMLREYEEKMAVSVQLIEQARGLKKSVSE